MHTYKLTHPTGEEWILVRAPRLLERQHVAAFVEHCEQELGDQTRLLIDLSDTVFIGSAGISALLQIDQRVREYGGDLRIAGATTDVLQTLRMVRVDQLLAVYPSLHEALAS